MAPDNKDSFFFQYGKYISIQHLKKNTAIPFKDHLQFPILIDILARKYHHHVILRTDFSSNLYTYFMEALVSHLSQETIPYSLRCIDIIYLDIPDFKSMKTKSKNLEKD